MYNITRMHVTCLPVRMFLTCISAKWQTLQRIFECKHKYIFLLCTFMMIYHGKYGATMNIGGWYNECNIFHIKIFHAFSAFHTYVDKKNWRLQLHMVIFAGWRGSAFILWSVSMSTCLAGSHQRNAINSLLRRIPRGYRFIYYITTSERQFTLSFYDF